MRRTLPHLRRACAWLSRRWRAAQAAYLHWRIDTAERELASVHPLQLHPLQLIQHRTAIRVWRLTAERLKT